MAIITDPNASILWRDSTITNDKALLRAIIKKTIGNDDEHNERCIEKIINTIRTVEWQRRFDHRIFVFNVYYAQQAPVVDLSFALSCQAMDALYFILAKNKDEARRQSNFAIKVKSVFKEIYNKPMPPETATAIRIIRNDIMHTGEIMGIPESRKTAKDTQRLKRYFEVFNVSLQNMTSVQRVIDLAVRFDQLVADITLKILGLDDSDIHGWPKVHSLSYFSGTKV